jgi:hypothetical protein
MKLRGVEGRQFRKSALTVSVTRKRFSAPVGCRKKLKEAFGGFGIAGDKRTPGLYERRSDVLRYAIREC